MATQGTLFEGVRLTYDECYQMTIDSIRRIEGIYNTWFLMWSGGKDSTTMVTVILELIRRDQISAPKNLKVFIADTRMELIPLWQNAIQLINQIEERGYSVEVVMPEIDNRFWVYMLGYGVPPPSNTFRWCTDKLKLAPIQDAVKRYLAKVNGTSDESKWEKVLMMTGVRLGESAARDARIKMSCSKDGGECGQGHYHNISNSWNDTLAPIVHWRVCIIWDWLMLLAPGEKYGGGWATELRAEAYGDGEDIEARTGCIGCNLASKDKALLSIIKNENWTYLSPLLKLRGLYALLKKPENRLRLTGYQVRKDGKGSKNQNRLGPLTFEARKLGLDMLKAILSEVNLKAKQQNRPEVNLLNTEEEKRILWHWQNESWPGDWDGTQQRGDLPFIQFFADGSSQPDLFH